MELCKISPLSSYHKHYKDKIFVVVNRDGKMVNIKYRKFPDDEHFTGICVPIQDINVIQLNENKILNGLTGMMKLLSGKKQKIQVIETIKIGSKWGPINESPWPKPNSSVTILDVKDGWVRYDMGSVFRDERMEENIFLKIYKEVECV